MQPKLASNDREDSLPPTGSRHQLCETPWATKRELRRKTWMMRWDERACNPASAPPASCGSAWRRDRLRAAPSTADRPMHRLHLTLCVAGWEQSSMGLTLRPTSPRSPHLPTREGWGAERWPSARPHPTRCGPVCLLQCGGLRRSLCVSTRLVSTLP